jgi:Spy/CpxP family protein refolding chaperone
MRMMKMSTIGGCVLAALLAMASSAGAQAATGAGSDDEAGPLRMFLIGQKGRLMTLRAELGVTGEQRAEIRTIVRGHRQEIVGVVKPLVANRRALREAVLAENPDEAAIRAAASELGSAIGDAAVLASQIKPEVFKVLTPEQQKKVSDFRADAESAADRFLRDMAVGQ